MNLFEDKLLALKNSIKLGLPGEEAHGMFSPPGRLNFENALLLEDTPKKAAVLIPLFLNAKGEPAILLTLRKTYPGVHSGQISFPGGKFEKNENSSVKVALREAKEEVGIDSKNVSIIGELSPLYIPPSHIIVFPILGYLEKLEPWEIQEREVEQTIELSISDFMEPSNKGILNVNVGNQKKTVPSYNINGTEIWGATAMIISEFLYLWNRKQDQ